MLREQPALEPAARPVASGTCQGVGWPVRAREGCRHALDLRSPEQQHRGPPRHGRRLRRPRPQGRCGRGDRDHRDRGRRHVPGRRPEHHPPGRDGRRRGARGLRAAARACQPAGGRAREVRLLGAGRHRGHLEDHLPAERQAVRGADAGAVLRCGRLGLRLRTIRDRPLLLPGRPQALCRPLLLRRAGAALRCARRLRPGLRRGARGRPSRADAARRHRSRCSPPASRSAATRRTSSRS